MTELSREYFARDKKRYWRFYWILVPILHFLFHPVVHGSESFPEDGPLKIYPETAGSAAYSSFGFNRKSQTLKLILFAGLSLVIAFVLTRFF